MTETLPSEGTRRPDLRSFERRRVQDELRAQLFGAPVQPLRVDRFEIRRRLGAGATGVAYAAFDPKLQREVALKLLEVAGEAEARSALQEARALARLAHPNVLTVHEAGEHEGLAFIVSELVAGGTLRAWLDADPARREPKRLVPVLLGIARGVAAAHQRGIAHRDLKPENVLVGHDGRPRVADFGLAITVPLVAARPASPAGARVVSPLAGTVAYMAPEQLRGERADPLSDQFSFCVLAFEALFGALPYVASSPAALLVAIESGAPAAVPADHRALALLPLLRRGLAADAGARFGSMDEIVRAIERVASRRRRLWLGAAAAGLVVAGGAVAAWLGLGREDRSVSDRAAALSMQGRYDECADYLERKPKNDQLYSFWLGCAEAAQDPRKLERACDGWPTRMSARLPEVCAPVVRKARALRQAGRFKECADTLLAAPPLTAGMRELAACTQRVGDTGLYRRQCKYMQALQPPKERNGDCDAGVVDVRR